LNANTEGSMAGSPLEIEMVTISGGGASQAIGHSSSNYSPPSFSGN